MTRNMLQSILATTEKIDGPQGWIHLCTTAAEEAAQAEAEALELPAPRSIAEMCAKIAARPDFESQSWEADYLYTIGRAYGAGLLVAPSTGGTAAASAAYRANLPPIHNRRSVQSFVACVAMGVLRGHIAAKDANQLLYVAQVALSAFPKRTATKARK